MPKRPAPKSDWLAWGLLAGATLVTLCVLTQEPPPKPGLPPANLLGWPGEYLAQGLFQTLGSAVYALLVGWYFLAGLLLVRRMSWDWVGRGIGLLLLVPVCCLLADWVGPETLDGFLPGSGGSFGALLRQVLDENFPPAGQALILSCTLALGLYLAAGEAVRTLFRGSRIILGFLGRILARVLAWPFRRRSASEISEDKEPEAREEEASPYEKGDIIPIYRPKAPPAPVVEALEEAAEPRILTLGNKKTKKNPTAEPPAELPGFDDYHLPALTLLEDPDPFPFEEHDQKLRDMAVLLEKTFTDFDLNIRVVGINTGPVITQYEVALETGLRLNKVTTLADDLALNLKVPSVRVVAPIPGKNTVGIEVPNEHRARVRLKDVILTGAKKSAKMKIPLFLGKDTEGRPLVYDLAEMPHLLIAGRTGTGKSVCLNTIILSMLMTKSPDEVRMVMIDPKMLELSEYGQIPHLMHPVVKDMKKAEAILGWAVDKMEERYDLLSRARVRGIAGYNELSYDEILRRVQPADDEERKRIPTKMPYIVIFVDEMGDLMMTMKREVEGHIIRLAQKSRAAGIHLVVATQKPTVDVITGLIKSNLPARICFQVSSRSDSRVVLDEMGAEKLLGKGDMLFLQPGTSTILRSQGAYASDEEITRVVQELECDQPQYAPELMQLKTKDELEGTKGGKKQAREELYDQAVEIVIREGRGSVSLLQRALGIGYGKAARFIDFMAEDGIVGPYNGSNAREVMLSPEEWTQMRENREAEVG